MTQRKLQNLVFAAVSYFLPNPSFLPAKSFLVTMSLFEKVLHLLLLSDTLFHTIDLKRRPNLNGFPYLVCGFKYWLHWGMECGYGGE